MQYTYKQVTVNCQPELILSKMSVYLHSFPPDVLDPVISM